MARKRSSHHKRAIKNSRRIGVILFAGVLLLFAVIGILIPLRPSVSEVENRKLTEFPKFTVASFLSGDYFSDVSLWYSDTFPMRDTLISANMVVQNLYGIKGSEQVVGDVKDGDAIPVVDGEQETSDEDETEEETGTMEEIPDDDGGMTEEAADETAAAENAGETAAGADAVEPESYKLEKEIQNQMQSSLYVKDGAAYTTYSFSQKAADTYIKGLNKAAERLNGITNVYSILIPLNSGAVLDEATLQSLGGSDQTQTIDYYYNSYKNVTGIETIRTLREHRDEYIFYRTDHHWTSQGAYLIYRNFCEVKGWTPNELSSFETMTFTPFLGTYYTKLDKPKEMKDNPDVVTAYIPHGTNEMQFTDKAKKKHQWEVIHDVSSSGAGTAYSTFIGGDQPMAIIKNPNVTDGSTCLVLKESYANCFVPFLVDHYSKVYVVDFRYAKFNVASFVEKYKVNDFIIVNNIGIINSTSVAKTIKNLIK